jgi:hypothetical protein
MKAFFMLDELNQFHWTMLKSVLLILMLLPITEGALSLWQATEGSSQIMIGFCIEYVECMVCKPVQAPMEFGGSQYCFQFSAPP